MLKLRILIDSKALKVDKYLKWDLAIEIDYHHLSLIQARNHQESKVRIKLIQMLLIHSILKRA